MLPKILGSFTVVIIFSASLAERNKSDKTTCC